MSTPHEFRPVPPEASPPEEGHETAEREGRYADAVRLALENEFSHVALYLAQMHEAHLDDPTKRSLLDAFKAQDESIARLLRYRWGLSERGKEYE